MKGAITAMKNIDYDGYLGPRMTRDVQRRRLQHVLDNELTELQRRAVIGYYLEKKTMRELAQERGVNKSTVCRTLQRARAADAALPSILSGAMRPRSTAPSKKRP